MKPIVSHILCSIVLLNSFSNCVRLRGVTLESHPFVIRDGTEYKGYIIDILRAIQNISDLDYYLYDANDLGTVDRRHQIITGLLGEVWTNAADFGISNIEVTEERKIFVDFTDPVLNYSVSALLNRRDVEGTDIRTFEELADQTRVTYGSLRDSRVMEMFGNTTDFMLSRMFALMHSRGVPVDSLQEAIQRVRRGKYAFIGDSYTVEEMAKSDCDLTVIRDNRKDFRRHISIALLKGSDLIRIFNIHLATSV